MVEDEPRDPRAVVDGFEMGMYVSYDDCGDAWVRSPDSGAASLIWETGEPAYFCVSIPAEPDHEPPSSAACADLAEGAITAAENSNRTSRRDKDGCLPRTTRGPSAD